jgi:hypothetical protein
MPEISSAERPRPANWKYPVSGTGKLLNGAFSSWNAKNGGGFEKPVTKGSLEKYFSANVFAVARVSAFGDGV